MTSLFAIQYFLSGGGFLIAELAGNEDLQLQIIESVTTTLYFPSSKQSVTSTIEGRNVTRSLTPLSK